MSDLYTRAFERLAFPLLDRLNRTSIVPKLEHLLASEHVPRDEIRRRQEVEVERVVASSRRRSAFYRQLWERRDGPRSDFGPLDGLPLVTKTDFAAAEGTGAFPLPVDGGRVISCVTSGSTGRPMTFHRSIEQESWFWALRFRIWRWAGYHPGDPYLTINLNPRLGWKKQLQDRLFRCAYMTFNADNQDSVRILDAIEARGIEHLNGFSSSLYVLAEHLLRAGRRTPSIRGVTATGDTLFPVYRDAIEKAFGVRVLDYYGAGGEGVHLASQTRESGERYLLHPENALVEILGPDGPAPPGTVGRIAVTQFHNDAMPLVRYELGDLAVAAAPDARCPSGRTLPMLERLEGRIPDLVVVPDGSFLVPHFFVVLFKSLQTISRYQIHQARAGRMTARLVAEPDARPPAIEDAVRRAVDEATRGQLEVDFEWVESIPLTGAGKRRLVISELSRQLVRRDDEPETSLGSSPGSSSP